MHKFLQVHEGENSFNITVPKGAESTIVVTSVNVDNATVHLRVRLTGIGAKARVTGIIVGRGKSQVTIHTMQVHEAPQTTSDLLIKSVLSDRAKCLYDGGILVTKRAQRTDAYQRNENLLLSGRPYAQSKPSLEILANDVRCTHGATAGPIDAQQLWYLKSRGIPQSQGESLIVDGFIGSALDRILDAALRTKVYNVIHNESGTVS